MKRKSKRAMCRKDIPDNFDSDYFTATTNTMLSDDAERTNRDEKKKERFSFTASEW